MMKTQVVCVRMGEDVDLASSLLNVISQSRQATQQQPPEKKRHRSEEW